MSALEKIRKHSGLLITFIGVALVAFILGDLFRSGMDNNGNVDDAVVVVNGEKIPYDELKRRSGADPSAEQFNNVLEQMIKDRIMKSEYEAVGMNVSQDELDDLFLGDEPHEWVTYFFQGNYSRENVEQYISAINGEDVPQQYRDQWHQLENAVKDDRLEKKFTNLVKASYFVPTKLAEKYYNDKNEKTSAEIIAVRYDVNSKVEITEQDKNKYYQENKYKFETDATRDIEYVIFPIEPSEEDNQSVLQQVTELKDQFAAADNVVNFVNFNSEFGHRYDSTWKGRTEVPVEIESAIFDEGHQPGDVIGPYFDNNAYNLARIVDFQNRADSLKASHILIAYGPWSGDTVTTKEIAQKRADSIVNALKKNPKDTKLFGQLASKYSFDKDSSEKEGELDWFVDGASYFDYKFYEFVQNHAVGQIGVVEAPYGFHVVKVTGKTEMQPKARLAVVRRDVVVSPKTDQAVHYKAHKFASENNTYDKFNAAAEADGLVKRSMPMMKATTFQIAGIDRPRQIVQWAFNKDTKVGDVNIFDFPDMFVVAALTDAVEEGYAPMEKIAKQYENQILNMKRGEEAVRQMEACGNDYDRMVKELKAEQAKVTDVNIETRNVLNFGTDPNIVGTILGMKQGEVVGPIAGGNSAFIIKSAEHQPAPAATDYSEILRQKRAQFDNNVMYGGTYRGGVYSALRNKAKIKDNRLRFY